MVAGWVQGHYWPHHALAHQPAHLHLFNAVLLLVVRIAAFVCIIYYVRGRNWARVAVLVTSVVVILGLLQLRHEDALGQVTSVAWALLGVFFLYWLNTHSVREFFKRGAANIERS
jgi:hypothetical protein